MASAGRAQRHDGTELQLFGETDRPWEYVASAGQSALLKRYFRERAAARFGIYWDTADSAGRVAALDGPPKLWPSRASDHE